MERGFQAMIEDGIPKIFLVLNRQIRNFTKPLNGY
jgi:hypothetical protein